MDRYVAARAPFTMLAFLFCLTATASAAGPEQTTSIPAAREVVARVNGTAINAIELLRARKVINAGQPGVQTPPEKQGDVDKRALDQLVSAELLYQAGQKLEIRDMDALIDARIAESKRKFPSEQDFEKAINALEMSISDLRDYTRRDLVISNFIEQAIVPRQTVGNEESKTFYDQNLDKFSRGEAVRASHILVGTDTATPGEKEAARAKAEKLRKELASGADFATLARDNSTCPSSKQGGDLGYFGKGQMVPTFEQAAFALKKDGISEVVETQFGFHIIKLTDRKGAETVPYQEVKPRIEEFLKGQKVSTAIGAYLAEARKTARIELLLK